MSSRTPIRLTPHRGPLATPPSSAESSPTMSFPLTDISYCSLATGQTPSAASLQRRMSSINLQTRSHVRIPLDRRKRKGTIRGLLGHSTHLTSLNLSLHNLTQSTHELAQTLTWIVLFCLLIWGILEWSPYASEPPRQSSASRSPSRFPRSFPTRVRRCHVSPSSCEPDNQQAAVMGFISEQVQHAKAISSLSDGLGSPFRTFIEAHRTTISNGVMGRNLLERHHRPHEADPWTNLTEPTEPPLIEFTSSSFIGRSLSLALEELDDLISDPPVSRSSAIHAEHHLHAVYWRTSSNLLLEYSAARPRARRFSEHLHALHRQLSSSISGLQTAGSIEGRLNIRWWKGVVPHPTTSVDDKMEALVTGLEAALSNVQQLIVYLDWITEHLAQTTLRDVLKTQRPTDFASCLMSLQDLFAQSKPSTSKKFCFCLDDYGLVPPRRLERVEIVVPGSATVLAER